MSLASPLPTPQPEPTEEELLQRCLDGSEAGQLEDLEHLCRAHPALAAGLRRRYAMLASHGLVSLPLTPGHRWGPYRLLKELGRGGMGVVYLAEHVEWKRRVALKFLSPELASSERAAERFRREIATLARLDHPGLCTVYEAGEHHRQPFVAMRHVPGRTLAAVLADARAAGPRLEPATVLQWFEAMARAVDCAHMAGIVHRDLKPANVMLQDDGRPVVLDFGLARDSLSGDVTLTASQDAIGTPPYMAPEQVTGGAVGPWTDVHALGAMLHEALTLSAAFPGTSRTEVFHRVLHEAPTRLRVLRPDLGRDLELVLGSCLDKDPARRYARAGALADDLLAVQQRRPIAARPLPAWLRSWRWGQRNRVAAVVLASVSLLAMVAVWFAFAQAHSDRAMRGRNLVLAAIEADADADLAAMYAEAAYRLQPNPESLDFLRSALFHVHEDVVLRTPGATWYDFELVGDEHVVVGGADRWCQLWHRSGNQPPRRLELPGPPQSFAVGPDGTIAVGMSEHVRLFDTQGNPVARQRDGLHYARSLHWLDARRLVVARRSGATVLALDGSPDVEIDLPDLPNGDVVVSHLSADRSTLVIGTLDRAFVVTIRGDEVGAPQELPDFARAGPVFALAAEPRGRHVLTATSSYLGGTSFYHRVAANLVRWWRRQGDGWDLVCEIRGFPGEVFRVAIHPDGERFAFVTGEGQVWVHAASDGRLLYTCEVGRGNMPSSLTWSQDGSRLVVSIANRLACVFGAGGMREDTLQCFALWKAEFEADARHVWTLGMESLQRLRLDQPERLRGHGASLYFAAPLADGRIVTCGKLPHAIVWLDGQRVCELRDPDAVGWVMHAAGLPNGDVLTVGSDSRVRRFDRQGRRVGAPSPVIFGWLSRVLPLPDGRLVVISNGAPGALLLTEDLQSVVPLRAPEGAAAAAMHAVPPAHGADVTSDGRWLALGLYLAHRVQVWDLQGGPQLVWEQPVESSFVTRGIALSEDGRTIVVGDGDGDVTVFDRATGSRRTWRAHAGPVFDVDLATDGRIATASGDRTAAVWHPRGERLAHLHGQDICMLSARFLPSGRHVVTANEDGTARIWPLAAEDVLALARRDVHPETRRAELAARADLVGDLLDRR